MYVSGTGATLEPRWHSAIFARVKGETEAALAGMRGANPLFRALSARPCAVDAAAHDAVQPYLPARPLPLRAGLAVLGTAVRTLAPGLHSPTEELGRVLTGLAMGRHDKDLLAGMKDVQWVGKFPIIENPAIRRLGALSK